MANARSSPGKISLIQQFLNDFVGETMVASPTLECFQRQSPSRGSRISKPNRDAVNQYCCFALK
jgi:hypothetical protein